MKTKKVITIHLNNDEEKEEFLRELQKAKLSAPIYVHGKLDSIRISIQGTKGDIRETTTVISDIQRRVRRKFHPTKRGLYRYNLDDIASEIPTSTLLTALKIMGEKFEVDTSGKFIKTSLPWEQMRELIRELSSILREIAPETTRQIREVVVPLSAVFGLDPMEVIDELVEAGAAEWKDEKFKYELIKNKEQALTIMLEDRFKYKRQEEEDGD